MKIVGAIVNTKRCLIGFQVEGRESEFGGVGSETVYRSLQVGELVKIGFKNYQMDFRRGTCTELNGFKIKDLPTFMFDGVSMTKVDNSIKLVRRLLLDDRLIGFDVLLGGEPGRYKYNDVLKLSNWYNPVNFVIRNSNETSKMYIAGKQGQRLENLPALELSGNNTKTGKNKKKQVGTGGSTEKAVSETGLVNDNDLISLLDYINEKNGIVIKLPDEEYKSHTIKQVKEAEGFNDLGVGEIGNPNISFGETKLNANITFKKMGTVTANISGNIMPLYTYVWREKSIFNNGNNYMKKFGVGISKECMDEIQNQYKGSLVINPLNRKEVIDPVRALTGNPNLICFEVDATKLNILPKDRDKFLLDSSKIYKSIKDINQAKLIRKYAKAVIKQCKTDMPELEIKDKKLFGMYAGMSPEYLEQIKEHGIDIITGAYIKTEKVEKDEIKVGSTKETDLELYYSIKGIDYNKIKVSDIIEYVNGNLKSKSPLLNEDVVKIVNKINSLGNTEDKLREAETLENFTNKIIKKNVKILWFHKLSMLENSGNKTVHNHDKDKWVSVTTRKKNMVDYTCEGPGCEGLIVSMAGLEIK